MRDFVRACRNTRKGMFVGVLALVVSAFALQDASADTFASTPSRIVGPYTSGQTNPAPAGGWAAADDRTLNASINGQGGWQTLTFPSRYDQEIATGIAHSGGHSWRLSNWFHTGLVNPILSPQFASIGETGATNLDAAPLGGTAQSHHVVHEFWFRSAAPDDAHPEPGSAVSTTISDARGNRMTYLGLFDEPAGPGGPSGNGCPTANGCFHVDAVEVTSGNDAAGDGDGTFVDHYSPALTRGVWYRAHIDATFVDGPGPVTTDAALCPASATCHTGNDQIHYEIFDASGNVVFDSGNIGSWEAVFFDGRYGNPVGTIVASDYIGFRVSGDPDNGTQQPSDTNSVTNRPHGVYIDDFSVTPDVGAGITTSFDFDRYVATTGSDTSDCSVQANPCLTIAYAINQSNAYDTLHVASGLYPERSSSTTNLTINKPIAIEGAQAGIDARSRADTGATVIVPGVQEAGLGYDSTNDAVVTINSDGVSLDGLIVDGDNPAIHTGLVLNGADPDVSGGIFAAGNNITVRNTVLRNLIYVGIDGAGPSSSATAGSLIQFNHFNNITAPSKWGRGVILEDNFYAQVSDNLMDQVRVGVQLNNNYLAAPNGFLPAITNNEIHATRTGIWNNLFSQSASTWTISGNHIFAAANAAEAGTTLKGTTWSGVWVSSMQSAQTVTITGNVIDGGALAGSGRPRAGYLLDNIVSSAAGSTAFDGGSVAHVDAGVLSTNETAYGGAVNDFLVRNVAFDDVSIGAFYVEDTDQGHTANLPVKLTIGDGNTFTTTVAHELALSGTSPQFGFADSQTGAESALVRSARTYLNSTINNNECSATPCTVSNASINAGIGYANVGGVVAVETGTFDEAVTVAKNGIHLQSADPALPAALTRATGGPNQPVLVVNAAQGVQIANLSFAVDKSHATEGILASGFVDGLTIQNNQFTQSWSNTSAKASYGRTNAISINVANNSLGLPRVDGSNVTITGNTIAGSTTPNATLFRAGIAMDAGVGTISGNTASSVSHDTIVRFATVTSASTANGVSIANNHFNGGGIEFDAPNAGITPITITGNTITAPSGSPALTATQAQFEADISILRLIDNQQKLPVTVSGNQFSGYANGYRGALVENFPNATFSGNTFTPLAGAADFASLVVSNKEINTDNPPEAPYPMSITALQNTFNGSGVSGTGRAVEFINDNDANGTASFGTLAFGDNTAANANTFDPNHQYYFNLVDQHCDTLVPPGTPPQCTFLDYNDVGNVQNTQVRPFRGNVYAVNNLFGGVAPRAMSPLQQAQLNAQTNDINDDTALGYVDYGFTGAVDLRLQGPVANVQVGVATPYTAELANTGAALTEDVLVQFSISRTNGIQPGDITLQYDAGSGSYQSIPLSACGANLCGKFGPPAGFPVAAGYDVLSNLRDTLAVADTYTVHATVQGVSSGVVYAANTLSTQVVQSPANIGLALAGPQTAGVGAPTQGYGARLSDTGGATSENVLVDFAISRSGGIGVSDVTVQYDAGGGSYQPIPLSACGANLCGSFGPQPGGFPVGAGYDITTPLRISYARSGAFTVNANVDGVTSHASYASAALTVTVASGAAQSLTANGGASFTGTAGQPLAGALPSVKVTDAGGNPVTGVAVTFAAAANSGTLSGATQTTDGNGIATLGGWILSATPGSDVVNATAAGVTGSTAFTATGTAASGALGVSITDQRDYVQAGRVLTYTITVGNSGSSNLTSVAVTDTLPAELDTAGARWQCIPVNGATCTASGSGNLTDTADLPAGSSVVYLLTATVNPGPSDIVSNAIAASASSSNASATDSTQVVIFRDGFENGGDGAQWPAGVVGISTLGNLSGSGVTPLAIAPAQLAAYRITPIAQSGNGAFRVDAIRLGNAVWLRLVARDGAGERFTAWSHLDGASAMLALGHAADGSTMLMLVGTASDLQVSLDSAGPFALENRTSL